MKGVALVGILCQLDTPPILEPVSGGGLPMITVLDIGEAPPTRPPMITVERSHGDPSKETRFPSDFDGDAIWLARCAACHGSKGQGNTKMGRRLGARDVTSVVWQDARTDDEIKAAIVNGRADTGMKAYLALGTDEQFDELVVVIRNFREDAPD